jgi:hypothetical protein
MTVALVHVAFWQYWESVKHTTNGSVPHDKYPSTSWSYHLIEGDKVMLSSQKCSWK